MKRVVVFAIVGAFACSALAQGGGGGGQGRGGGGFGGRGMQRGMGDAMLLQRADVQKEIALTAEQKTKLEAIQQRMQEERRTAFEGMANGGGQPDREVMQKMFTEMQAKSQKAVEGVLTPEQTKRLKELGIQRAGSRAVMRADVQKDIGVTDEQKAKITALHEKQEAQANVFEKMRNGEIEREQIREIMEKNDKILGEEIAKVLTDAQRAKLKEMGGKEFKFDPDQGRGGR